MPFTRADARTALNHVVGTAFGGPDDGPLAKALEKAGHQDIRSVVSVTATELDELRYNDSTGAEVRVPRPCLAMIETLSLHVEHRVSEENPIGDAWTSIAEGEFDAFRMSPCVLASRRGHSATTAPPPVSSATKSRDPLAEFKKGVKRDASLFPTLKDEKQWDQWRRSTVATGRAQGVEDIFNPSHTPLTPDDVALFAEKNKCVHSVFECTLLTDQGKACVRDHENDYNAQKVFQAIQAHAQKSTKASLESSKLLSRVTSARIGDGSWKGTAHGFILHWQNQVRLCEQQVPATDHLSTGQKRTLLENTVHDIEELRAVKNQADQCKAHSGKTLTHEECVNLLASAASNCDAKFSQGSNARKPQARRGVYSTEMDDAGTCDIDSPIDVIRANAHKHRPANGVMPSSRWRQLTAEARSTWDTLSDDMKAIILGSAPSSTPPTPRKTNLHEISACDYLQANRHDMHVGSEGDVDDTNEKTDDVEPADDRAEFQDADDGRTALLNCVNKRNDVHPADIRKVLSQTTPATSDKKPDKTVGFDGEITVNGKKCREVNVANSYRVSQHNTAHSQSLVDRGANGGVAGADVRVINMASDRRVDIRGIDDHELTSMPLVTAGAVTKSQRGEVIVIMHQCAHHGKGKTIHSCGQLESHCNDVNDRSIKIAGGLQRIRTNDGCTFPLSIADGLPHLKMRPCTDEEWDTLPHVILTSDADWDPRALDHSVDDDDDWFDAISDLEANPATNLFDECGECRGRVVAHDAELHCFDADPAYHIDTCDYFDQVPSCQVNEREVKVKPKDPDPETWRPHFGWLPVDVIKRTFAATTRCARAPMSTVLKKHCESPFPALNVPRRDEAVAADTVCSDTPAADDGSTSAQFFVGVDTLVTDVCGMKSDKQFVNTLEDNICDRGAMNKLISDRAQVEVGRKVKDILRALVIGNWQSEPHQQQQNPAERRLPDGQDHGKCTP